MEKFNFVKDGVVIKLPPGFRFQPTDKEIVFHYLTRKIFSYPLPASIIPEINICEYDPRDSPGELAKDQYFFSEIQAKYRHGNRSKRATPGGYWKAIGLDKQVMSSKRKPIMGLKKTLVFYKGKPHHGVRTDWVMHEFRLVHIANASGSFQHSTKSTKNSKIQMGNCVLCHIFLKNRSTINTEVENARACKETVPQEALSRFNEFVMRDVNKLHPTLSCSSSSISDSSIITNEICSSELDCEETTSRYK